MSQDETTKPGKRVVRTSHGDALQLDDDKEKTKKKDAQKKRVVRLG